MEETNVRKVDKEVAGADDGWTRSELEKVGLGDCRPERRLRRVAEDLSRQPEYPINVASNDAASTKAAYRLFDNERASVDKILGCHVNKTLSRMQHESVVLAMSTPVPIRPYSPV